MLKEFRIERKIFARQQRIAEKTLAPIFRKALRDSVGPVIDFVKYAGTSTVPSSLINNNVWLVAYQQAYSQLPLKIAKQEYYRQRGLEVETESKASAIDFLVDVWSSIFRDYALNYVYQISRELNDTTVKIITEALNDVNVLGLDRDGSIRLFIKTIEGKLKLRTNTISRTEATTISNLGKDVAARSWIEEQGGQGYKVWLGRNDIRERPSHIHENDVIIPIDDKYELIDPATETQSDPCLRPGDVHLKAKNRIRCRCTQSLMTENRYSAYLKRGRIIDGKLKGAS
jgi:hypothetical protein